MMKFVISRNRGAYYVSPPQGDVLGQEVAESSGKEEPGRYTLVESGAVTLPRTPGSSFRESVRKSLRRLRRNKKKRGGGGGGDSKRRKEDQASYQVTVTPTKLDREEEEVYEVIKPASDPEHVDEEEENDRVVIVHESRKPSFKSDDQSLANSMEKISADVVVEYSETKHERNSWREMNGHDSVSTSSRDVEMNEKNISVMNDPHHSLIPRGPLGDLLKQKISQSSVETVIIHREIEDEDIAEQNIEFKVEHIPEDGEVDIDDCEDVERSEVNRGLTEEMVGSVVERHLTPALVSHPRQETSGLELPLSAGDLVFLHRRLNTDWYLGEKKGVRGLIPAAYIQ